MKLKVVYFLIFTCFFAQNALSEEDLGTYEQRLNTLIENGVIDKEEAQQQLVQIKSKTQQRFHRQVRGVASKIKDVKVYEIVNEPLEIPSH